MPLHDDTPGLIAYTNARLIDPASKLDAPGAVLTEGKMIVEAKPNLFENGTPSNITNIDCQGACLSPGLVDIRMHTGEPGEEHKNTSDGWERRGRGWRDIHGMPT